MPQDVGELIVRLTLESGGFSAAIKNAEKDVSGIQADFRAAAAEAGNFGQGLAGAQAKAQSLANQVTAQSKAVKLHEQAVAAANKKLTEAKTRHTELGTSLQSAREKYAGLEAELKKAEAAHKAAITATGENSDAANELGLAVLDIKDKMAEANTEIKSLEKSYQAQTKAVMRASTAATEANTKYSRAREVQAQLAKSLDNTNKRIKEMSSLWGTAMKNAEAAGQKQIALGSKLTKAVTAPIVALGVYGAKSAIDFESAFAGVEKTVDGTAEQLARIRAGIIDMSGVIPKSTSELSAIAEAAGQLGIKTDNILAFTEVVANLRETTNLGEDGAAAMAKFANVTQMSQDLFGNFASTVVDLGNKFATTEQDIVSMAMRLAGAGKQVGLSEDQILAFSAALSSVGIEAEAGGSAFSKIMIQMQLATETGKNGLKDFARVSGMTAKEFKQAFEADAAGAIQSFIVGLSKMDEEGISAIKMLDDMGIKEVRLRDTLLRAQNAQGLFASALSTANSAWRENTALTNEAEKRYKTFASRLELAKNQATALAQSMAEEFIMPGLEKGLSQVSSWIKGLNEMSDAERNLAKNGLLVAAGIGPGLTIMGKANQVIGKMSTGFKTASEAAKLAGGGVAGFGSGLASLIGPAGMIALTAGGIYLLGTAFEWLTENALTTSNEARKAFERIDPKIIDRWAGSFDRAREAQTTLNVQATVNTTKINVQEKLDELYQPLVDAIEAGKTVDAKLAVKVNATVDSMIDELVAGIERDTQAKLNGAKLDLDAGLIDSAEYDKKVADILSGAQTATDQLEALRSTSADTVSKMVGDTTLTADDAAESLNQVSEAIGTAVGNLNSLSGQLKIKELFDSIGTALTDGKADTKEQTEGFISEINTLFDGLKADVEKKSKIELSKVDVNSASYDSATQTIKEKNEALLAELNQLQEQAVNFVTENSGRSTAAVEADMAKLEAINARITEIRAELSIAQQEQESVGVQLVKGGRTGDADTITNALEGSRKKYDTDVEKAKAAYDQKIAELQEAFNASTDKAAAEAEYTAAETIAKSNLAQQEESLAEAYRRELAMLLKGATEGLSPELSNQLSGILENVDMGQAIQDLMNKIGNVELEPSDIPQKIADAMNMTPEALLEAIRVGLALGDVSQVTGELTRVLDNLDLEASRAMADLDLGEAGGLLDRAIENGLLDGLDDLDLTDFVAKLRALFGDLGQTDEPLKYPMSIETEPKIKSGSEGDQELTDQLRDQAAGQLEGGVPPVEADVDVETNTNVTSAGSGDTDLPTQVHNNVAAQLGGGVDPVEANVQVNATVTMSEDATSAAQEAGQAVGAAVTAGAAAGITAGQGDVQNAAGGMVAAVSSVSGDLSLAGYKIGQNFVRGVANGITAGTSWIREAAAAAARAAKEAAQSELDIHSPSGVGKWIGKNFGLGEAIGIKSMAGEVERASKALQMAAMQRVPNVLAIADVARAQLAGTVNNVGGATTIQNTYNTTSTTHQTNNVNGMVIRRDQDIDLLAEGLAQNKNRKVAGVGGP